LHRASGKVPSFLSSSNETGILRGIFGPTKENQIWRIKNNEELDKLIKHENIVNYIKAQTKLVRPCTENA